jgi:hypothetical protein
VGDHGWEDVNWNGEGHRTVVNIELGTMCWYLYQGLSFCTAMRNLHVLGLTRC